MEKADLFWVGFFASGNRTPKNQAQTNGSNGFALLFMIDTFCSRRAGTRFGVECLAGHV